MATEYPTLYEMPMLFRLAANSLGSVAEIKRMATGRATKYFRLMLTM